MTTQALSLYKLIYQELHKSLYPYYVVIWFIREQENTDDRTGLVNYVKAKKKPALK